MTNPIAMNHALDRLAELNGRPVELEGVLMLDGERYQPLHYPKSERRTEHTDGQRDESHDVWKFTTTWR